jgi:hypothetical protein
MKKQFLVADAGFHAPSMVVWWDIQIDPGVNEECMLKTDFVTSTL